MYGLTPTLKNEIVGIAPKGRVNSVNPGWIATPLAENTLKDKAFVERALATTPLQKVGTPPDIARQVAVLASPSLSGHVNGMNLMVDGGMEGRLLFPPQAR
jgi:NAD(P)-dependent dehydrogenase (short-subunit alcohol dehydrogenase family)